MIQIIIFMIFITSLLSLVYYLYEGRYELVEDFNELEGEVVHKHHSIEPTLIFVDEMTAPITQTSEIYEIMIESNGKIYEGSGADLFNKVKENQKVRFQIKNTYKKLKDHDHKTLIKREIFNILKKK